MESSRWSTSSKCEGRIDTPALVPLFDGNRSMSLHDSAYVRQALLECKATIDGLRQDEQAIDAIAASAALIS